MTLQDDVNRMLADAYAAFDAPMLGEALGGAEPPPTMTVHKYSAFVPMSVEQLLDAGLITETEARAQGWTPYVPLPVPWSRRLRWRWQAFRERAGRKIGGWIAGEDLSERDEDW